ncbi:hypothetical protein LMG28138_00937 [Pararobbsia alpina]|uniref:Uncharacterized protein n=1 Tax=Pararobbsia alpina TaxID=621374 RepID=A0A6S7AWN3_9BURK|nr:hypothetical protein LMG28138_00937 [Pararobbsia alpina]
MFASVRDKKPVPAPVRGSAELYPTLILTPRPDAVRRTCASCTHRDPSRAALESSIPGLSSLGSGFGASVGESRLCRLHDRLVSPGDACAHYHAAS